MADLVCIEPGAMTAKAWPFARDLIRRAIEKTNLNDFAAVERATLEGRSLLWLALEGRTIQAAATTELATAQGRKSCVVVACSGEDRSRWLPLLDQIEAYARAEGCVCMRIVGRRGWERVLHGYSLQWAILEKGLVDGTIQPEHHAEQ